jgi:hypothetical protein
VFCFYCHWHSAVDWYQCACGDKNICERKKLISDVGYRRGAGNSVKCARAGKKSMLGRKVHKIMTTKLKLAFLIFRTRCLCRVPTQKMYQFFFGAAIEKMSLTQQSSINELTYIQFYYSLVRKHKSHDNAIVIGQQRKSEATPNTG